MDEMLSQEEINALLRGLDAGPSTSEPENKISEDEKDAIGEVSNISMGTAATTLFALVNQKVVITTPTVSVCSWSELIENYKNPCVAIQIVYKEGFDGTNILILKEEDVKIITDLMMGGDGTNPEIELTDLHLSAISEAMNQMIGSAATSMSSMFHKKIDIKPPMSNHINFQEAFDPEEIADFLSSDFIKVAFKIQIGDLVDSEMIQLYPLDFAKDIYNTFVDARIEEDAKKVNEKKAEPPKKPASQPTPPQNNMGGQGQQNPFGGMDGQNGMNPNAPFGNPGMPPQQGGYPGYQGNPGMGQQGYPNPGMDMNYGYPNNGQNNPYNAPYPQQNFQGNPNYQGGYPGMNQGYPGMGQAQPFRNVEVQQAQFQSFDMGAVIQQKENIDLIMDVKLEVTVELGRTHKSIKDILEFAPGTIIELNKLSGEPIDVLVNGKIVAKGEVVVIDENFSIRITDIIKQSTQIL